MQYKFNKNKLDEILEAQYKLRTILHKPHITNLICPYDNIVLYSNSLPNKDFCNIVMPTSYYIGGQSKDLRYRFF